MEIVIGVPLVLWAIALLILYVLGRVWERRRRERKARKAALRAVRRAIIPSLPDRAHNSIIRALRGKRRRRIDDDG